MTDAPAYDAVLVLATLYDLDPHFLGPVISKAASSARNRVTVVLLSPYFDALASSQPSESNPNSSHTELWDDMQKLLTVVYVQATSVAQVLDRVLMDVEVLLRGVGAEMSDDLADGVDVCYRVEGGGCPPTPSTNGR